MKIFTTRGLALNQKEISFEIQPEAASLANWLLSYFEKQIKIGKKFKDGETVELGWSMLQLREAGATLEAYEPDFDSMPIRWCRGVSNTIRHLTLQQAICNEFECEPNFPSIRQAGTISPSFLKSEAYTMSRDQPVEADSGWVLAEDGYSGNGGEFHSLYQIALHKVLIVPFLALPESAVVRIRPGSIAVTVDNKWKSSEDCQILQDLVSSTILV